MCNEDVELHDPALPEPLHGRAGTKSSVRDAFPTLPDVRLEPLDWPILSPRGDGAWGATG